MRRNPAPDDHTVDTDKKQKKGEIIESWTRFSPKD